MLKIGKDLAKLLPPVGGTLSGRGVYGFCPPAALTLSYLSSWRKSNRVQLNAAETEALRCTSIRHQ